MPVMENPTQDFSYQRLGFGAFVFSFLVVFLFLGYLVVGYEGVDLKEDIRDVEDTAIQPQMTLESLRKQVQQLKEPWKPDATLVAYGKELFQLNCASCHGPEGLGNGPAGAALTPPPRNLVKGPWKLGGGYIGLYRAITEGIPGSSMASYRHLSLLDRWALVQFISSITEAKVTEDPQKVEEFARQQE